MWWPGSVRDLLNTPAGYYFDKAVQYEWHFQPFGWLVYINLQKFTVHCVQRDSEKKNNLSCTSKLPLHNTEKTILPWEEAWQVSKDAENKTGGDTNLKFSH